MAARRFAAAALALGLLLAAGAGAASAQDALELRMRSGSSFRGKIQSSDDAAIVFRGDDGITVRLPWKDLDERSWLAAKRAVTPATDARGLLDLGKWAAEKSFRGEAEALLQQAIRIDPALRGDADLLAPRLEALRKADAAALFERGRTMLAEHKYLHALGRFREARELDPSNALAANGIGEAHFYLRRLGESRTAIRTAIGLDAACKDAHFNLAVLDLLELDFASCLAGLERVIALPAAAGKAGTREELDAAAKAAGVADPEKAWETLGDAPLLQARDLEPMIRGVVAGPGFAKEYRALTAHYDLRTDVSQEYADQLAGQMELIYAEYERRFGYSKTGEQKTRGKDLRFPVLVFQDRQGYVDWFGRVLRNPEFGKMTGGVYVTAVKHLVFFRYDKMEDTRLVAWHEGFHQYLDYFVAGAPHWFNEGQAEYFGASSFDAEKRKVRPGQTNPWRIGGLAALVGTGRLPSAKWFMQTDAATFMRGKPDPRYGTDGRTTVGEHYIAAWALVHFCQEGEKGRWQKNFLDYFKSLCDGDSHEEAFQRAWGRVSWDRFQEAWERHCRWLVARAQAEQAGRDPPPAPK